MRSASKLSAFILFVAATPIQSFQVSAPLAPSRVSTRTPLQLAPRPITLAEKRRSATLWSARDESEVERDSDLDKLPLNEPVPINNFLRQLSKLRPLLLSLTIFLLPLFLSLPSWAVQSGGRIGGSVGGSNRSSGGYSRSYGGGGGGSYSSGFSRGYSSGYYSRPSVVVSPGITPYYRWVAWKNCTNNIHIYIISTNIICISYNSVHQSILFTLLVGILSSRSDCIHWSFFWRHLLLCWFLPLGCLGIE